ncbi:MAG TPA: hypothetical protein VFQ88_15175 [Nevskiaceae bacterium]|nr:hypothetical protein [Nevskiaceae bacterium]
MKRYVIADVYGELWQGGLAHEPTTITPKQGESFRHAIERELADAGDFQGHSTFLGPNSVVVIETTRYQRKLGGHMEVTRAQRWFACEVACLEDLCESPRLATTAA